MKKYVSTTYTGCDYITAGKLYEVEGGYLGFDFRIMRDDGFVIAYRTNNCWHLDGNDWQTHDGGTIAEIGAKVGDVIGNAIDGSTTNIISQEMIDTWRSSAYYIISRAADAAPKKWGDMTDAEKGDLLLWAHEGGCVDLYNTTSNKWTLLTLRPQFKPQFAYRKKPAEPVRKSETIYTSKPLNNWGYTADNDPDNRTHSITFETVDGEIQTGTFTNENGDVINVEKLS